jgi:ferredoxin
MQRRKRSNQVKAYPEKCAGCMSCALACSWTFAGVFNPLKSRILINYPGDVQRKIIFTRDCNNCGVCVDYCNFDALEVVEG